MVKTNLNKGYVTQIIGPVLDIKFSEEIYRLFIVQREFR
jgi:F0F1-type ATP synthase beta subunit